MPRYEVRFWVNAESRHEIHDMLEAAFADRDLSIRDITNIQPEEEEQENEDRDN
jgi:hypothetical protein